jgi:hypothetical protein
MGFLDSLFKRGTKTPKEEPKKIETAKIEPPKKVEIKAGGEMPLKDIVDESKESPRTVKCLQFKYGKLLESKDGPIKNRDEHHDTLISKEFPKSGLNLHPNKLFFHQFDNPEKYPWTSEGGEIVKRLIEIDGKQFVVCAKRMMRSEDGEKKPGRNYTEMHAVLIPANEWSVSLIPQINNILEAKGVVEKNIPNANPIELKTDLLDEALPENWFDEYVKDLISKTVSGKPISLQDWDVSEKDFLKKLFYTLICLPESIARKISYGTGLARSGEGEVRIAHTKSAGGGVRKIGKEWRGEISPDDIAFGQKYLIAVNQLTGDCKTPRDIMKAMKNLPEDLKSEMEKRFI